MKDYPAALLTMAEAYEIAAMPEKGDDLFREGYKEALEWVAEQLRGLIKRGGEL